MRRREDPAGRYRGASVETALREIERALSARADTDVFVLGNHGLVLGGEDAECVERLLAQVRRRLSIHPRKVHPADYAALW